jgi:hypothetical protein
LKDPAIFILGCFGAVFLAGIGVVNIVWANRLLRMSESERRLQASWWRANRFYATHPQFTRIMGRFLLLIFAPSWGDLPDTRGHPRNQLRADPDPSLVRTIRPVRGCLPVVIGPNDGPVLRGLAPRRVGRLLSSLLSAARVPCEPGLIPVGQGRAVGYADVAAA